MTLEEVILNELCSSAEPPCTHHAAEAARLAVVIQDWMDSDES